jgi:hypothetical protein
MNAEEARVKFGKKIQRCYGCFVAFYIKDLWLNEEAAYYCKDCKDDSMIHFDDYSEGFDFTQLPSMQSDPD